MRLIVRIRRYRANFFFLPTSLPQYAIFILGTQFGSGMQKQSPALNARNKTPFHAGKSDKRPQIYFLQVALKFELKSSFEVS